MNLFQHSRQPAPLSSLRSRCHGSSQCRRELRTRNCDLLATLSSRLSPVLFSAGSLSSKTVVRVSHRPVGSSAGTALHQIYRIYRGGQFHPESIPNWPPWNYEFSVSFRPLSHFTSSRLPLCRHSCWFLPDSLLPLITLNHPASTQCQTLPTIPITKTFPKRLIPDL